MNFAQKGIGQHCLYVISILRSIEGIEIVPVLDPVMGPLLHEAIFEISKSFVGINEINGDIYLNPSPLTYDTAAFVIARRRGLKTCAVVHDFIPFRSEEFLADEANASSYRYLVASLANYDALFPNSLFTKSEIIKFIPGYHGTVITVHCRPRFLDFGKASSIESANSKQIRPATVKQIASGSPYVFVATADDPRKNPDIAIQAALDLRALGLTLFVGGGISETTRKRLFSTYPAQCLLGEPIFLPRLTDAELYEIYLGSSAVIVGSFDEGFSLPVAEAIALGRVVVASRIPAHLEQIKDPKLLFEPDDVRALMHCINYALAGSANATTKQVRKNDHELVGRYSDIDYVREQNEFKTFLTDQPPPIYQQPANSVLTIVGPSPTKATGIAVYNTLMLETLRNESIACEYVDVDSMENGVFYDWLLKKQGLQLVYVIGNNNIFHTNCFISIQNAPGLCILHDSRMFEFLLNRFGPHYIFHLSQIRNQSKTITIDSISEWQRERWRLPDSFLDPIVNRSTAIIVHSLISARHIRDTYEFRNVHYLPFALQMSKDEVDYVVRLRAKKPSANNGYFLITSIGETEATKGCVEIVFALKILLLQGFDAHLNFVGKSDEPYHSELINAAKALKISNNISFTHYVTRQKYLESLAAADVVVQLRYPIFGQVSGPLADAIACGVPAVTTDDLAIGMGFVEHSITIPNRFSPLHIAEGIRKMIENGEKQCNRHSHSMDVYVKHLIEINQNSTLVAKPIDEVLNKNPSIITAISDDDKAEISEVKILKKSRKKIRQTL